MKSFNTTAVCIPSKHYMVDISERVKAIKQMVDAGKYFTINRARQYGKTTTLTALRKALATEYLVLSIDFQGLGSASFQTEEEFCKAFKKERTYPYITPLYLNSDPRVKLSGDKKTGTVEYDQAARIVGMVYDIRLVYENGDYYVMDWEDFLDGSYLDKFEDIPYASLMQPNLVIEFYSR